jgi:hypothetical protein
MCGFIRDSKRGVCRAWGSVAPAGLDELDET